MRILAVILLLFGACAGKPSPMTTISPTDQAKAPDGGQPEPPGDGATPVDSTADKAVCTQRADIFGPFSLDETQARHRYGANARTFSEAPTTKEQAIEVCGIDASRQWLRGTACTDGSAAKQNGRTGSVGSGGRCGAIIDHYTVTCPERDYDVYIDMYMCGPGESMR